MTPKQFRTAIERLGLSQERSGLFFGYSPRQGQRWASGDAPIPTAVEYLIKAMIEHGHKPVEFNPDFA